MIEDPENIIEGYDPSNPVHNPAAYITALQEAERDVRFEANKQREARIKDRPGDFAKLGCVYWILIILSCLFLSYLFTL